MSVVPGTWLYNIQRWSVLMLVKYCLLTNNIANRKYNSTQSYQSTGRKQFKMSLTSSINWSNLNFLEWDYPAIYEGVMSPENNFIMIIQNIWLTITSSIGYLFLIPFYNVSRSNVKWETEEEVEEFQHDFSLQANKLWRGLWFLNFIFIRNPLPSRGKIRIKLVQIPETSQSEE